MLRPCAGDSSSSKITVRTWKFRLGLGLASLGLGLVSLGLGSKKGRKRASFFSLRQFDRWLMVL